MKNLILSLSLLLLSQNLMADIAAVTEVSKENTVARVASDIFEVRKFKIGNIAYKLVTMDSQLNGDLSATTVLMVGENGVGGAAGYDAAFIVTATETVVSAKVVKGRLQLVLKDHLADKPSTKTVKLKYDPVKKILKTI